MKNLAGHRSWWRQWIAMRMGESSARSNSLVLGRDAFQQAIHTEWSRSQRTSLPLALIVISEKGPNNNDSDTDAVDSLVLDGIIHTLEERKRCTDIVGWLEVGKLGVLLPHTTGDNAWTIVHDVMRQTAHRHEDGMVYDHVEIQIYAGEELVASGERKRD